MKVVIIIPTYNEKGNIERLIEILENDIFPKIKNHDMNILVADDNSPDGTADEVKKLMKKFENLDLNMGEKHGLGAAYVRAMTYAIDKMNAEVMFEMDADLSHDPNKIPDFLKKIDEGYDFVIGTRYSQGGSIPSNWGLTRKMFSVFGNLLVRIILLKFSIHDWTGGFRAMRKEVFLKEKEELTAFRGYTFQVSFLNKVVRDEYKVAEIPIHFTDRTLGRSKIAPKEYIIDLLKYIITTSIKEKIFGSFGKFLVVGGTGFVIQLIVYRIIINATTFPLGLSNLLSAQLAIFSNYNLNNLWTFKKQRAKGFGPYILKMFGFFASSNTGVLFIQSGIVQLGEILFGRQFPLPYVYFVFATGILLIYNFTMYRFVIWRKKPHK
ncbi:MAG: glycosyltransferase family 2 protein [Patescibacteria group bacterium]